MLLSGNIVVEFTVSDIRVVKIADLPVVIFVIWKVLRDFLRSELSQ